MSALRVIMDPTAEDYGDLILPKYCTTAEVSISRPLAKVTDTLTGLPKVGDTLSRVNSKHTCIYMNILSCNSAYILCNYPYIV